MSGDRDAWFGRIYVELEELGMMLSQINERVELVKIALIDIGVSIKRAIEEGDDDDYGS